MSTRKLLKNPIILGVILGLAFLSLHLLSGILQTMTGIITILIGAFFLILTNYGLPIKFKMRLKRHILLLVTFLIIAFIITILMSREVKYSVDTIITFSIYFIILGLIINLVMNMKKGHLVTIIILTVLTVFFILYSFVKNIEAARNFEFGQENYQKQLELNKQLENQEIIIDSLRQEISNLRND